MNGINRKYLQNCHHLHKLMYIDVNATFQSLIFNDFMLLFFYSFFMYALFKLIQSGISFYYQMKMNSLTVFSLTLQVVLYFILNQM